MVPWVHTRAKSRLSWQNYVQEVVCKKVDVKNATPDVAERPPDHVRPSVPFRVRIHTITLFSHLNDLFWLQTQTGTRML